MAAYCVLPHCKNEITTALLEAVTFAGQAKSGSSKAAAVAKPYPVDGRMSSGFVELDTASPLISVITPALLDRLVAMTLGDIAD
jgi:hypothetical protein